NEHYHLRVEGATEDVFGIGRYAVATTFDHLVSAPASARLNNVLTGPYDQFDSGDLAHLFTNPYSSPFNCDHGCNDNFTTATTLVGPSSVISKFGSIESKNDVDMYRIHTPDQTGHVALTVSFRATAFFGAVPTFDVLTADGKAVATTTLFNGVGRATVQ